MISGRKIAAVILFALMLPTGASAQGSIQDTTRLISQINAFGAQYLLAGDFANKFFSPTMVGAGFHIKNYKNWIFGADGGFLFRDGLPNANDYLKNMRTEDGYIIAQNGTFATIVAGLRGFAINAHIGKLFTWIGPNPNSGVLFRAGAGFFQHKIHLEARRQEVPQVEGELRKYYDQLTNGLAFNQFIGYQHLSNSRLTNFYIGIEAIEAFTQNRRDFNIDLGGADDAQRLDVMVGLKAGWIILIYKRKPDDFYFY